MINGMNSTKIYMLKCREIVWAPFPFSDHINVKHRPALIISGKNSHGDLICLPVTSTETANCIGISTDDLDGKLGFDVLRLITHSYISFEQPMTLDANIFDTSKPPIATLTTTAFTTIKDRLMQSLCE